jgi:hypothetical protein
MVAVVNLSQGDLFSWYVDQDTTYFANVFWKFKNIIANTSKVFFHEWRHDMNIRAVTLSMRVGGVMVVMHCCPNQVGE